MKTELLDKQLLKVSEAAKILGWSRPRVYDLISSKKLNSVGEKGQTRLHRDEVEELAKQTQNQIPAAPLPTTAPGVPPTSEPSAPVGPAAAPSPSLQSSPTPSLAADTSPPRPPSAETTPPPSAPSTPEITLATPFVTMAPATVKTPKGSANRKPVKKSTPPSTDENTATGAEEVRVKMAAIIMDDSLQVRASVDPVAICGYAELMKAGERFPAVQLFKAGDGYFIGDGWHRILAAKSCGFVTFPAVVNPGGRAAALRFALSANSTHGLPRTNEDKLRALSIADKEYPTVSNRELGRICAVSEGFVRSYRIRCVPNAPEKRIGKDGKSYDATRKPPALNDPGSVRAAEEARVKRTVTMLDSLPEGSLTFVKAHLDKRIAILNAATNTGGTAIQESAA